MNTLDFAPFFRSSVGFDRTVNAFDSVSRIDGSQSGYPPYNIELVDENNYAISLAVAGFKDAEIEIEVNKNILTITGERSDKDQKNYLHRGIASRNFNRRFQLADHVQVTDAQLEDGLLVIALERQLPEALKPRRIAINDSGVPESDAA